jgi:hypothetical protein
MAEPSTADERRRFSRIPFHRPAELDLRRDRVRGEVLDVSLKGARVQVPHASDAAVGQPCALVIRLDAGEAAIRMDGVVAHRCGTDLGFRCDAIDLESIVHLRRLVELNLGDEALLYRELTALVASR